MMFSKDFFAERLRGLMEARDLSQGKLASIIGVSRPAITQFCTGSSLPSIETLIAIADAMGVSLDELVGREWPRT